MNTLRTDIAKALDTIVREEAGVAFQELALACLKPRYPTLASVAHKADQGADAVTVIANSPDTTIRILACSLTARLGKLLGDAEKIKNNYPGVQELIFATPTTVTQKTIKRWQKELMSKGYTWNLIVYERHELLTVLETPGATWIREQHLSMSRSQSTMRQRPVVTDEIGQAQQAAAAITKDEAAKSLLMIQYVLTNFTCKCGNGHALVTPENADSYVARIAGLELEIQTNPPSKTAAAAKLMGDSLLDQFLKTNVFSDLERYVRLNLLANRQILTKNEAERWNGAKNSLLRWASKNTSRKLLREYANAVKSIGGPNNVAYNEDEVEHLFLLAINELQGKNSRVTFRMMPDLYAQYFRTPHEVFPRHQQITALSRLADILLTTYGHISFTPGRSNFGMSGENFWLPVGTHVPESTYNTICNAAQLFIEVCGPNNEYTMRIKELAGNIPEYIPASDLQALPFKEMFSTMLSGINKIQQSLGMMTAL